MRAPRRKSESVYKPFRRLSLIDSHGLLPESLFACHADGPTRTYLDGGDRNVWIALAPSTDFYFEVRPTRFTSTAYRVRISKRQLNDAYEANDSHVQAKTFSTGRSFSRQRHQQQWCPCGLQRLL